MQIQIVCVTAGTAGKIMGIGRTSVWRYIKRGWLDSFRNGVHTMIPLQQVADHMGLTLYEAIQLCQEKDLGMWQCWKEVT